MAEFILNELWTEYSKTSFSNLADTWFTNVYYHDARSEFIITKEDLNKVGISGETEIHGLMFNLVSTATTPMEYAEIGIKHTTERYFPTDEYQFQNYGTYTIVGAMTDGLLPAIGWNEFFFDTAFTWDGESNIQVCLIRDNSIYGWGGEVAERQLPANDTRYIGGSSDSIFDQPFDGMAINVIRNVLPQTIIITKDAKQTFVKPNTPQISQPIDNDTVGSVVRFSATLTDNEDISIGDSISLIVEYSDDSKFLTNIKSVKSSSVKSGEIATVLSEPLQNGKYYWRAMAVDSGNLYSDYTGIRTFNVDNKNPYFTSISPSNNTIITTNSVTISATPIDLDGNVCTVYLEVAKDINFSNIFKTLSVEVQSGNLATFYITDLLQGNYYWRMRVSDSSKMSNYTSYRGIFVNIQTEENGRIFADGMLELTGLSGTLGNIQDDPDAPNSLWLTSTGASDSIVRVSFPTPRFNLKSGASLQNFRVQVRSSAPSGTGNGTVYIDLYENGVQRTSQSFTLPKSSSSTVLQMAWNASLLSNIDGSGVECRVRGVGVYSGNASNRWSVEIGAVKWNYQSGYTGETHSPAPTDIPPSNITSLATMTTGSSCSLSWKNPTDYDFSHLEIYRDSILLHSVYNRDSFVDSDLSPSTSYTYKIVSVDMVGNKSNGTSVIVTTDPIGEVLPQANIISVSATKISNVSGKDKSIIKFSFDVDVVSWTVNVMGVSYDSGYIADSGGAVSAGVEIVAEIDYTELYQEGENRVNIYGKNANGWTLFDD